MRYLYLILILSLFWGCAQNASVEIGFNDGVILAGTFGDMIIRVSKIEAFQNAQYTTIWENGNTVSVPVNGSDFCSITGNYVSIVPGTYRKFRVTIDSLSYKIDNTVVLLLDSNYQFIPTAFSDIVIEDGDEYRLVIGISSSSWFESESLRIKPGHSPFENATLKIFY
ncbi:MAG: hypothetical protein ABIL22_02240 [candidate division WOR-3 bacterium]